MEENKRKKSIGLLIIVIVLQIAILGILGYYTFFKETPNDNCDTNEVVNKEEEKVEVLTKDSAVVKELYSYITLVSNKDIQDHALWELVMASRENTSYYVETKDISSDIKNIFAFDYISDSGISTVKCENKYASTIKAYDKDLACGLLDPSTDYTTHNKNTTKLNEEQLKLAVEKIFGVGSYTAASFGKYDAKYVYYKPDKAYILAGKIGGATANGLATTTIANVSNTKDTLILKISIVLNDVGTEAITEADYNFTYKLNNGNYYLYSIARVKG